MINIFVIFSNSVTSRFEERIAEERLLAAKNI